MNHFDRSAMFAIVSETEEYYADPKNFGYNHEDKTCEYLSPEGACCAVGRLNPAMAGALPQEAVNHVKPKILSRFLFENDDGVHSRTIMFLKALQRCHDEAAGDYSAGREHWQITFAARLALLRDMVACGMFDFDN